MVFSEYEVRNIAFKFEGEEEYIGAECVGSCEETMNTKVITKKCRGVIKKKRVKPDGTGVLKYSLHMPWDMYVKAFDMEDEQVKDGVYTYGIGKTHKNFCLVEDVFDEDDNEKLKAYPNCVIETGRATKTENGAEEVAELEMEVAVSPDDYGIGVYDAMVSEVIDETIKTQWMTDFTPELVRVASV